MKFFQLYDIVSESTISTENDIENDSEESLSDKLEQHGWNFLARGSFGTVYSHPDKNYVLKSYIDEAYDSYIEFIQNHASNPHVVKIKKIYPNGGMFKTRKLIAIEKLNPLKFPKWASNIAEYYGSFLSNELSDKQDFYSTLENFEKWFVQQADRNAELFKAIKSKKIRTRY